MKNAGEIREILEKKIFHEEKIVLLQQLLEKEPHSHILKDFIAAEKYLIKKNGLAAAKIYDGLAAEYGDPSWLVERMAKTLAKYAYFDMGSGPVIMAHEAMTKRLGMDSEKAWKKLGDILKTSKGFGYAAQCYANADMAGTAARMFEKLKQPDRAAFYYEQEGEHVRAARMYKRHKLYDKAGENYAKAGFMKLAVQQWKKAGTLDKHNVGYQTYHNLTKKKKPAKAEKAEAAEQPSID
jgi:tetratricopeptide (TPR) repeat protein